MTLTPEQRERYGLIRANALLDSKNDGDGRYDDASEAVALAARADLLRELEAFVLNEYSDYDPINGDFIENCDDLNGLETPRVFGESFCYHLSRFAKGEAIETEK